MGNKKELPDFWDSPFNQFYFDFLKEENMGIYYCRKFAVEIGEISEEFPIPYNLIGTEHKLEKKS